jgi:type II secretory pathway pseudopilin PulG
MKRYSNKALTFFELVIALIIISIFAGSLAMFIIRTAHVAKETALRHSLENLRSTLVLYKTIKRENPKTLKELLQAKYGFGTSQEVLFGDKFLSVVGRDDKGYPIDPFGNRFYYNPRKGTIRSLTEGYKNW